MSTYAVRLGRAKAHTAAQLAAGDLADAAEAIRESSTDEAVSLLDDAIRRAVNARQHLAGGLTDHERPLPPAVVSRCADTDSAHGFSTDPNEDILTLLLNGGA